MIIERKQNYVKWGSEGTAPHKLNYCTIWKRAVSFMDRLIYPPGRSPHGSTGQKTWWELGMVWTLCRKEKRILTAETRRPILSSVVCPYLHQYMIISVFVTG
jgi:hypothetical protein